ncbi:MAG: hypothetical protein KGL39_17955 [Patescibacteria group bacterium]|nr:hypothetical protein [Patescibacteria group bacterium]
MNKVNHRLPPKGQDWQKWFKHYGVLISSQAQRKAVWKRDGGICHGCGDRSLHIGGIEADHIFPLHLADREKYPEVWELWSIKNLQTLGRSCRCHRTKSNRETSARAKIKRIRAKASDQKKQKAKIPSRSFHAKNRKFGKKLPVKFIPRKAKQLRDL